MPRVRFQDAFPELLGRRLVPIQGMQPAHELVGLRPGLQRNPVVLGIGLDLLGQILREPVVERLVLDRVGQVATATFRLRRGQGDRGGGRAGGKRQQSHCKSNSKLQLLHVSLLRWTPVPKHPAGARYRRHPQPIVNRDFALRIVHFWMVMMRTSLEVQATSRQMPPSQTWPSPNITPFWLTKRSENFWFPMTRAMSGVIMLFQDWMNSRRFRIVCGLPSISTSRG